MPGTLFVVSTPIGNLEDVSPRALRVLREAALIAAEDTRRTAKLLSHFDIHTPTLSLHAHNERQRTAVVLGHLRAGDSVALVSDAGTPLVSDPGAQLVRAAEEAGSRIEAIPGPSAVLAALVSSGLPAETFTFLGFAPARAAERRVWLRALAAEPRTTVFFEAPHRIEATLREVADLLPDRALALGRELTKVHEEVLRGTAAEVLARLGTPRGELTVVIGPPPADTAPAGSVDDLELWTAFCALTDAEGLGRREAVAALSRRYGQPAREVYAALERAKGSALARRQPAADKPR